MQRPRRRQKFRRVTAIFQYGESGGAFRGGRIPATYEAGFAEFARRSCPFLGLRVVLHGLASDEHNGLRGEVTDFHSYRAPMVFPYAQAEEVRVRGASRDRYIVKLESDGRVVKIRPENLTPEIIVPVGPAAA